MSLPDAPVATKADPSRGPLLPPTPTKSPPFHVGQAVLDVDQDRPNPAIVVDINGQSIAETRLPSSQQSIADVNPDYPADDPAVTVVFLDEFRERVPHTIGYYKQLNEPFKRDHPDQIAHPLHSDAIDNGVSCYAYPASRLTTPATAAITVAIDTTDGYTATVDIVRRTDTDEHTTTLHPTVRTASSPTDAGYQAILAALDELIDASHPVMRLAINIDNMDLIEELCTSREPRSDDFHQASYTRAINRLDALLSVRCARPSVRDRF